MARSSRHRAYIDRAAYEEAVAADPDIPIFFQPWWMDGVCGKGKWYPLVAETSRGFSAVMPVYRKRKYGLRLLTNPPFTPYQGPWIWDPEGVNLAGVYSFQHKAIRALLEVLPAHSFIRIRCHPSFANGSPFLVAGLELRTRFTYRFPPGLTEEGLYNRMSPRLLKSIRKCAELVEVREMEEAGEGLEFLFEGMRRKGIPTGISGEMFSFLDSYLLKKGKRRMYGGYAGNGLAGVLYVVSDGVWTYSLMSAVSDAAPTDINALLRLQAVGDARRDGRGYDLCGSKIPDIERKNRGLGGNQYALLTLYRNKSFQFLRKVTYF